MKDLVLFLKEKKGMIFVILLASLLQAVGTLLVPYYVARMIDVGIADKSSSTVITIGLQMLAAAAFTGLVSLGNSYLCADLAARAGRHMREKLFDKTQLLSVKEFNQFGTASLITRATGDITVIQQTVIMVAQMMLPTPLIVLTAIGMTAALSPSLVYIPLLAMLIFFIVIVVLFRKAAPISRTIQGRVDTVNRVVRESINGIRVIRAFHNSEYERSRTDEAFIEYADNVIRLNRTFAFFNPIVWAIMGLVMAAVVWFGGNLVLEESLQVGSITAVTEYSIMMLISLMTLAMVLVMIPRMSACLNRIQEVLDIIPEIADDAASQGFPVEDHPHPVVFQQVSFSYQGAEEPVLQDLTFTCEQGKTTAIIGGTGSGKSTIAALLLRLYDIQEGQIRVGGQDIRKMKQHDLREAVGYIPQKAFLFSGTIADNLRMGNQEATVDELHHAARIAQAHDFIASLEAGYDSPVAQGGTNYSGGQKQRLCIARALVKKAPVYVFDDSFSALDYKTDAALRHALKQEMREAAVVIIAQRISTIQDADQIIVLDSGRIAGIGKHEELMSSCSVYREIADSQLTGREESLS